MDRRNGSNARLKSVGLKGHPCLTHIRHSTLADRPCDVRREVVLSVYRSRTMSVNLEPAPAALRPSRTDSWDTDPKAFEKSRNTMLRLFFYALASFKSDSTKKLFSYTPSWGAETLLGGAEHALLLRPGVDSPRAQRGIQFSSRVHEGYRALVRGGDL